mgnify:CR=1 FL=1
MRAANKNPARAIGALAIAAIALIPSLALACPVCFAAGGSRAYWAYYISTVLLSTMPFVLIGVAIGAAYLLRNRREAARQSPSAN